MWGAPAHLAKVLVLSLIRVKNIHFKSFHGNYHFSVGFQNIQHNITMPQRLLSKKLQKRPSLICLFP